MAMWLSEFDRLVLDDNNLYTMDINEQYRIALIKGFSPYQMKWGDIAINIVTTEIDDTVFNSSKKSVAVAQAKSNIAELTKTNEGPNVLNGITMKWVPPPP